MAIKRPSAEDLKRLLNLEELPFEGGFYRQSYVAADQILKEHLPSRYAENKPLSSAIFFLLTTDSFSALHKLPTDELYHYYLGDPAELHELYPDGTASSVVLGPDIVSGQVLQHVARRDAWQGSRVVPGGEWTLLGTTMAPAYTQSDFVLGDAATLIEQYPAQAEIIRQLTRSEGAN